MDAELSGIYLRLDKLEKKSDAQERALQLLAYYLEMDDSEFKAFVMEKVQDWADASDRNQSTSEEEKELTLERHNEILRLLLPNKPPSLPFA